MKTQPAPLKEKMVYGRRLLVWRNVNSAAPTATSLWATLPSADYDGKETQLHDWKADFDAASIDLRGAIYHGAGQWQQFEGTYPCERETLDLPKPRGAWEWSDFRGEWRNTKTGKRQRPS